MNTKIISDKALSVIDQYLNFKVGSVICSIPYFNNKHKKLRGAIRAEIGKGSPKDIFDEIEQEAIKDRIDINSLNSDTLKKFLIDKNIGIDCSGLSYYILDAFGNDIGKGSLDRHLSYKEQKGFMSKLRSKMRPVENTSVLTFAHDDNSKKILLKEVTPGDIITMTGGSDDGERNHIVVIHQVEYQNFIPTTIHYTHAIAWPSDGEYEHGVRQGQIEILNINGTLTDQKWIEKDKIGEENYTFSRVKKSVSELRRLSFYDNLAS